MPPVAMFILFLLIAFLSGSLPFGLWIGRARGVDVKKVGSGNIGFTNVWRSVGRVEGVLTLIGDVAKGALPTAILWRFLPETGGLVAPATAQVFFGLMAILGHCFSPFVNFKGGKGVATSLGVFLVLAPVAVGICVVVFVALVAVTRYISLGSIVCAILLPTLIGVQKGWVPVFWVSAAIGLMVVFLHRGNIGRLMAGTERKFGAGKTSGSAEPAGKA